MTEAALRDEVCRIGRSLFERGHAHATAGNISVRLPGEAGFLITPTDACLGFLDPQALAHVDASGTQRSGAAASKTLALHRRIYAADAEAMCVLHTHASELVALTLTGVWQSEAVLPPITPYFVMKVGRVPLIPYHRPGDPAVAELVAAAIARSREAGAGIRAVLCERLGPVVWQRTPAAAMAVHDELEETARLWRLIGGRMGDAAGRTGPVASLDAVQIEALRQRFGARW